MYTTVSDARTASADLLRGAARTDPGRVRTNNEDVPLIDAARGIFGVIDGVGGEAGGEVAAATAHDVILQRLARPVGTPAERVREAIAIANNEIFKRAQEAPALRGMACVVTLALVSEGRITVGHVGDTRLYKIRPDGLQKLTRDHSPVGEREDAGELAEVDAMRHPRRNEVFRDIGSAARDKDELEFVDVIEAPLERDSAILVCSDGLSDMLPVSTILHIVRQHAGDPARVVDALVAAANDAGGKDNVTAVYAEGAQFAAALGGGVHDAQTPTEPLVTRRGAAAPDRAPAPGWGTRVGRSIARSRTVWFILGLLLGVVGALGLTLYVARTQVPAAQTLVVSGEPDSAFVTITAALSAAQPGDTVRVEPGTYAETLVVPDGVHLLARVPGSVTVSRPLQVDPALPGVVAGGASPVRISGIRIAAPPSGRANAGINVTGAGVELDLVEISGTFASAVVVAPGASVTMLGSRVGVTGGVLALPDGAQATLVNNIFVRAAALAEPAITAGPLSRMTLTNNLFSGFPADIIRGVAEPRRLELVAGNIIVAPPPPRRTPGRR